ncbi:sortase domain-containing protein [Microbacterium rhizomatis]|uniref:Class F sortase n=1 Tax=Microbacterium rhizomatis TaxID=1631477 RepID=A0A5J5J6Q3_9MICO|nr:sortase [Microbacterium rhizomatis]KAA9110804.1 class F sortase [Microbacterium rhizomatis]
MRIPRRVVAGLAATSVAAIMLSGCMSVTGSPGPGVASSATPSSNPFAAGGLQDPRGQASADASASVPTPTRVRIPSIGVDTGVEDLAIGEGGRLNAPVDYDSAGWFAGGVSPGQIGPAIIAGHVDSPTAPAVFARIGELAVGADVVISMSDGSDLTFRVTGTAQSAKSEFPTAEVYSNVPAPELRLITCAGSFDTAIGHYTDNLIVFAVRA